ncbi:DUF433 domain-containing protein [Larkinella sp. VNQ87]|uniref:DUF433 domain-containing protein n=1 Tax=Larkinella sp. VNQ87 TaxID=3400921 RepID=UPI003C1069C6
MENLLNRITVDPKILVGKPIIRGMRISVELILQSLAVGMSIESIIQEYPELEREDIQAALLYAADTLSAVKVYKIPA